VFVLFPPEGPDDLCDRAILRRCTNRRSVGRLPDRINVRLCNCAAVCPDVSVRVSVLGSETCHPVLVHTRRGVLRGGGSDVRAIAEKLPVR